MEDRPIISTSYMEFRNIKIRTQLINYVGLLSIVKENNQYINQNCLIVVANRHGNNDMYFDSFVNKRITPDVDLFLYFTL